MKLCKSIFGDVPKSPRNDLRRARKVGELSSAFGGPSRGVRLVALKSNRLFEKSGRFGKGKAGGRSALWRLTAGGSGLAVGPRGRGRETWGGDVCEMS